MKQTGVILIKQTGVWIVTLTTFFFYGCKSDKAAGSPKDFTPYGQMTAIEKLVDHIGEEVVKAPNPATPEEPPGPYRIRIGDVLEISILNAPEMTRQVTVLPDGKFTYLLVGEVQARGRHIVDIRNEVTKKLKFFAKDSKEKKARQPNEPYRLKVGDVIEVSVLDEPEMTRSVAVIPGGKISYLLTGEIQAEGKTINQLIVSLESSLSKYMVDPHISIITKSLSIEQMEAEDIFRDPQVSVLVAGRNSEFKDDDFVSILGAVKRPDKYEFEEGERLTDIVAKAGGFLFIVDTYLGGRTIANFNTSYISRDGKRLDVDFDRLFRLGDMSQNVELKQGDLVYIGNAQTDEILVVGEVNTPRPIPYTDNNWTLTRALAWSGGFTERAQKSNVIVLRPSSTKQRFIEVDMESLLLGDETAKNVKLQGGDIIFVPEQGLSEYSRYAEYLMTFMELIIKGYQTKDVIRYPILKRGGQGGYY